MATLENYHQEVREAILNRTGDPILNGTIDHAAVIVQEALNNARESIRILSSRLDPSCYAKRGVVGAARTFLADPDHKIQILVEPAVWDANNNFDWERHPLVAELKDCTNLEVRLVPKEWSEQYSYNFLLLDDYGFRFEKDRSRPAAVAAFLPVTDAKQQIINLEKIFSDLWNVSKPYKSHVH